MRLLNLNFSQSDSWFGKCIFCTFFFFLLPNSPILISLKLSEIAHCTNRNGGSLHHILIAVVFLDLFDIGMGVLQPCQWIYLRSCKSQRNQSTQFVFRSRDMLGVSFTPAQHYIYCQSQCFQLNKCKSLSNVQQRKIITNL